MVLAGQPNVGKSSLLNALAGAELAIVTPIPGTTRDRVRETIQIEGIPLHIIDTAGLRDDTDDEVERIGIQRTWDAVGRADIVLHRSTPPTTCATACPHRRPDRRPPQRRAAAGLAHPARGQQDRPRPAAGDAHFSSNRPHVVAANGPNPSEVWISARSGAGIELLRAHLLRRSAGNRPATKAPSSPANAT